MEMPDGELHNAKRMDLEVITIMGRFTSAFTPAYSDNRMTHSECSSPALVSYLNLRGKELWMRMNLLPGPQRKYNTGRCQGRVLKSII